MLACPSAKKRVLVFLICLWSVSAAIRPSLNINACGWNATDILVVTPTPRQGNFRVVEAIKGETRAGAVLPLPELAGPGRNTSKLRDLVAGTAPFEAAPPTRRNDRVIVFLRRPGALPEYNPRPDLPVNTDGWQPANWEGDLRTSAVWLQDGAAFGFVQTMNPGPSHLVDLRLSEATLRADIRAVLRLRESLDGTLGSADPAERALKLAELVRSKNLVASSSALRHLENAGAVGAERLQSLLTDESLLPRHYAMIDSLVKNGAGGVHFDSLLQQEAQYWAGACRALKPNWWNGFPFSETEVPKMHYSRVYAALCAIRKLRLEEDLPAVRKFAAVWSTCPPLDEREPLARSQVSRECDALTIQGVR